MKLYDISQEVFDCTVFPGDPKPQNIKVSDMKDGALYNLTEIHMCAHNGTHVDSPYHFIDDGKTIDEIPLEKFIGPAYVAEHTGDVSAEDAKKILARAGAGNAEAAKRLLLKGNLTVTTEAAQVFADAGVYLIGNESQTVGPENAPMQVHLILLGAEVVLLEGIRLGEVLEGAYLLNAAPLNLGGSDGAPCRAVLMDMEE
ncbi:MAG: cyclase family protein [Lachnospiraceae bacterium]|nr:cyclase family protein [Lachnospiraceae bacterium]